MSIILAYRAESVGPICRHLAAEDNRIKVVHEDDLPGMKLISDRPVQQPAPIDPLIGEWNDAQELARAFVNVQLGRSEVVKQGISELLNQIQKVQAEIAKPAPVAPPPVAAGPKNVLIRFGTRWEGAADIEINSAQAVRNARDKRESRRILVGTGLTPQTWFNRDDIRTPAVIRPRRHHAGRKFYVCNTRQEIDRAIARCGPGWYASELIKKAKEYRVFILQDRVIRVSEKFPANADEIAWNFAVGGKTLGVKRKFWPVAAIKASLLAARKLNLQWTAVDVALDEAGKAFVFEANTQPGITGRYAVEQVGWAFASILDHLNLPLVDLARAEKWQDFIHPSLNVKEDDGEVAVGRAA